MPYPHEDRTPDQVEPGRVLEIWLRLGHRYYDLPPASDQIATGVWDDLKDSGEPSAALS